MGEAGAAGTGKTVGKKQLEVYEDPKVRDCWVSKEMQEWDERDRQRANSKPI